QGFDVRAIVVIEAEAGSRCHKKKSEFIAAGGKLDQELPQAPTVILDAIFGAGFQGEIGEKEAALLSKVNQLKCYRFAIDIPSGLHCNTGKASKDAFTAHYTLTIELPKIGFFIGDGWNHVGEVI